MPYARRELFHSPEGNASLRPKGMLPYTRRECFPTPEGNASLARRKWLLSPEGSGFSRPKEEARIAISNGLRLPYLMVATRLCGTGTPARVG